jgi:hypothetical protein
MEFKNVTPQEYLDMFPNIKLTKYAENEFKETTKLTTIVRLKGRKKFRPVFYNEIGAYCLINNREVYLDIKIWNY